MKYIKRILIIFIIASVGYLVAKEYAGPFVNRSSEPVQTETQPTEHADGIVMYYFYGNRRCPTCMAIERYSKEAVESYINNGKINWQTVNVEGAGNKHFLYDFSLSSSGPVLVEYSGGAVKRWLALEKVWQLVRNKVAFMEYIDVEIDKFINSGG